MRKVTISLLAAGTALAFAAPASAQYFPQPYGQPQGYGHGYSNYGQVRALQARLQAVRYQIDRLGRFGRADRLREEARNIDRRLRRDAQFGLNPYEANDINARISRLQQHVQFAMANRYRYGGSGYNGYNGYNNGGYYGEGAYGYDRDRDGRDDRHENDQGYDHDDD